MDPAIIWTEYLSEYTLIEPNQFAILFQMGFAGIAVGAAMVSGKLLIGCIALPYIW